MSTILASATILKTGPGTSIQDLGRRNSSNFGVPVSGAMDQRSLLWVNHLLQNQETEAVIEISQPGFIIQFDSTTQITLAGARAKVELNGVEINNPTQIPIRVNDKLEIGAFNAGARLYLGIRHGFQTPKILDSRSFYNRVSVRSQLFVGEKVSYFRESGPIPNQNARAVWATAWFQTNRIAVYPGPDFVLLDRKLRNKLFGETFGISNLANRMGIQLAGLLENSLPELPTNPVFPGTVQLTSGGKLIILLKDAQVTGGYPRILQLDEESQWIIAQKRPGDRIYFHLISP